MSKLFTKVVLAAGAIAALPSAAQAGTSTATGTATLTVMNQCSVTGATVSLGTYTVSQTWGDVANAVGKVDDYLVYHAGSRGQEFLNYGSITCDAGVPYSLEIRGTLGTMSITHNGKSAQSQPMIKKLGGVAVADNDATLPTAGANVSDNVLTGTGTGSAQVLLGSAPLYFPMFGTSVYATDTLGATGIATDTLTYTLNF